MEYLTINYNAIKVFYTPYIDGGGNENGQDFIRFIGENIGKVPRIFEWCAGPGFIGFSLLAKGLCNSLCLADINPVAVDACMKTINYNNLHNKVTVYLSDCLDSIPPKEKWDLIVGHPPQSGTCRLRPEWGHSLLYMDANWKMHERFYLKVQSFLNPNASVVVLEDRNLSSIDDFRDMIAKGGLEVLNLFDCKVDFRKYYIWCKLRAL